MSASLWYNHQQTSPFLCSVEDEEQEQEQPNVPADNFTDVVALHDKMNSDFSWISNFEDFSHFYDDNLHHQQAVANVLTTALAEKMKTTTFHVKGKRQDKKGRQRNWRNDMKENTQTISKKGEETTVDDEVDAAGSTDVCVYLRAKRSQAINRHSLAERVRRQKINDKMKVLQSLVPGCDKMTGKILVLDKIIDYIYSLQDKLKSLMSELILVDPALNFNYLALESTNLQTEKSRASTAGLECMRISSEYQSIPLHENSYAWASAPLSPWLALLEDHEYTI